MVKNCIISSTITLRVFFILIACSVLFSCSSRESARVSDSSSQYYKGKTHKVAKGETLFSISWRYGLDLKKLAEANNIRPPYTIYPGQQIRLDLNASGVPTVGRRGVLTGKAGGNSQSYSSKKGTDSAVSASKATNLGSPVRWQWPSSGKLIAQFQGESGQNKGIDIGGKLGEPVLAAASGRVVYAGSGLSGYGNLLIIKHNETFLSAYAHNDEISVKEGDLVKAGQVIADMGSSGTDRVKLHFEIRSDGSPVDPLRYLPKRQ